MIEPQSHNPGCNKEHPSICQEDAPWEDLLRERLRQQKTEGDEEEEKVWKTKALDGMYHQQIDDMADIKKSHRWREKVSMEDSTEAVIAAAQDQAPSTRSIEARVYHSTQDPRRWLCKDAP